MNNEFFLLWIWMKSVVLEIYYGLMLEVKRRMSILEMLLRST